MNFIKELKLKYNMKSHAYEGNMESGQPKKTTAKSATPRSKKKTETAGGDVPELDIQEDTPTSSTPKPEESTPTKPRQPAASSSRKKTDKPATTTPTPRSKKKTDTPASTPKNEATSTRPASRKRTPKPELPPEVKDEIDRLQHELDEEIAFVNSGGRDNEMIDGQSKKEFIKTAKEKFALAKKELEAQARARQTSEPSNTEATTVPTEDNSPKVPSVRPSRVRPVDPEKVAKIESLISKGTLSSEDVKELSTLVDDPKLTVDLLKDYFKKLREGQPGAKMVIPSTKAALVEAIKKLAGSANTIIPSSTEASTDVATDESKKTRVFDVASEQRVREIIDSIKAGDYDNPAELLAELSKGYREQGGFKKEMLEQIAKETGIKIKSRSPIPAILAAIQIKLLAEKGINNTLTDPEPITNIDPVGQVNDQFIDNASYTDPVDLAKAANAIGINVPANATTDQTTDAVIDDKFKRAPQVIVTPKTLEQAKHFARVLNISIPPDLYKNKQAQSKFVKDLLRNKTALELLYKRDSRFKNNPKDSITSAVNAMALLSYLDDNPEDKDFTNIKDKYKRITLDEVDRILKRDPNIVKAFDQFLKDPTFNSVLISTKPTDNKREDHRYSEEFGKKVLNKIPYLQSIDAVVHEITTGKVKNTFDAFKHIMSTPRIKDMLVKSKKSVSVATLSYLYNSIIAVLVGEENASKTNKIIKFITPEQLAQFIKEDREKKGRR